MLRGETEARIEVDDLPEVKADRVQMRQLFQNLIGNALKYRSEHKPVVRVRRRFVPFRVLLGDPCAGQRHRL